ncbi:hypothetical protein [Niabella hibiscisoli]|nr:hypothetical protein [Niabella hibiscisoli]MCH5714915.1 hypothetical protein [Niabella hibiscisoli]
MDAALSPRLLLLDASKRTKVVVALLWGTTIALPWILQIDFSLIRYLAR